jgi:Ethanolamine utilization protein EutJ (predicted chaperonin)
MQMEYFKDPRVGGVKIIYVMLGKKSVHVEMANDQKYQDRKSINVNNYLNS